MTDIVVLGAGYGGCAAVNSLDEELESRADITWVSRENYHLVRHEVHRLVRRPELREEVAVPVEEVKPEGVEHVRGEVTDVDVEDRVVELEDGDDIEYDYAVVALGSQTAFHGIDGLEEHAHTVKSLGDALTINEHLREAASAAGSGGEPATVVVGGGGLTGIQTAGEVAAFADGVDAPMNVHLVEHSGEVFPGHDHEFQGALREKLDHSGVDLILGHAVTGVDGHRVELDGHDDLVYDELVWAGGVTGQDAMDDVDVEKDHNRLYAESTFVTSDDRVFAVGDTALVDQDAETGPVSEEAIWEAIADSEADDVPPPTAEAAWEEGDHLGGNVARTIDGRELVHWAYTNKGTLVSVGDEAVAHDVMGVPVNTFSGPVARLLKKGVTFRWLNDVSGPRRALRAVRKL